MDRDCNKCVYSTREGGCRKFKCEGTKTVDDIRSEVIDDALNYCNQNNDEKEECWSCCLSIWKDGKFDGCYLEQLKEQGKNEYL